MLASCDKQSAAPAQPQGAANASTEPKLESLPGSHTGLPGANEQGVLVDKFKGQPLPSAPGPYYYPILPSPRSYIKYYCHEYD